jgi:hypothetical protein
MNPEERIKELIGKSDITTDAQTKKRILGDALEQLKQKQTAGTQPNIWRIIMKSSITKFAAVAAVIIMLLVFDPFGIMNSGGVVWAKVAQRVEQIETFIFGMTIKVSDPNSKDTTGQTTARWIIYLSEKYGFRMDIGANKDFVSWYVAPDANEMIMVMPGQKELIKWPLPADVRDKMPDEYGDPREYINRFMSRSYKELGRSVIDGVQVEGIEVKDPPTDGTQLENAVGRLWVDTEYELPVRIEIEGTADGKKVQWIMDFKWAEAVNPALFDPNRAIGNEEVK